MKNIASVNLKSLIVVDYFNYNLYIINKKFKIII